MEACEAFARLTNGFVFAGAQGKAADRASMNADGFDLRYGLEHCRSPFLEAVMGGTQ